MSAPAPASQNLRLGDELGRGALGRVVRIHDDARGEVLAGKMLHASHRADARALARFEGEARLLGGLSHPNLVGVRGLAEIGGERVLLMELVDGPSLAVVAATEAPLPPERVARLGRDIAAGLAEAHRAGLVHRDLKPANVLLAADGTAKIVDFGMARAASFAGVDPDAFTVVGTPDYMAPETIDPLAVDSRSDLYALGCILYELSTGRPPYRGATAFAVLEQHRKAAIPELAPPAGGRSASEAGGGSSPPAGDPIPRDLARVIRWLLAKSPADRPQSAAAVERALAACASGGAALAVRGASSPAVAAAATTDVATIAPVSATVCASCGAPCLVDVPVCFRCRAPQVVLLDGRYTVFVVGPGGNTHKIDTALRTRLLDWLRANPALGLDPQPLAKQAPRLPFVVATKVSAESANALARALGNLGLMVETRRGGRMSLPGMRKKSWTLGGRIAAIVAGGWFPAFHTVGSVALPMLMIGAVGAIGSGFVTASRPVAKRRSQPPTDLPPAIALPIRRVAGVLPAMDQQRHRDSLRGVVERALALRDAVPPAERTRTDEDLGRLLDLATVASSRIDELERALAAGDLRNADEALREKLRERDAWAARLLEVTAFLDALRARWAAATTAADRDTADALAELRAHIEALEEVQRL